MCASVRGISKSSTDRPRIWSRNDPDTNKMLNEKKSQWLIKELNSYVAVKKKICFQFVLDTDVSNLENK
ncbi:hypothetical protein CMV_025787 [Castanea mollissima]|uniref:Uncharacterized protein n=1 Tax=Castanea mollissima TaxID=60419 RepID=A0A8J4QC54_9ROSI|nr:hypothetical protein CMV_025787 [Castanea mollissima]